MKNQPKRVFILFAAIAALAAALISGADVHGASVLLADEFCTGILEKNRVGNLYVPENATCTLDGTKVDGNIFVLTSATLHATDIQVRGNIQADGAASVNVYAGSSVAGNIEVINSGTAEIQSANIENNLLFQSNDQPLDAANNTIGGNLQAFQNTGGVSITGNNISGNLQCTGNEPPPTGSGNIVGGSMEDQCANFGGIPTPAATQTPTVTPTPTASQTPIAGETPAPTSTPPSDTQAPSVQWVSPVQAGERYDLYDGQQVTLEVMVSDDSSISEVVFFRWDAPTEAYVTIVTLSQPPFQVTIHASTLNPGWNEIFSIATDQMGNRSEYPYIWIYKLVEEANVYLSYLPVSRK